MNIIDYTPIRVKHLQTKEELTLYPAPNPTPPAWAHPCWVNEKDSPYGRFIWTDDSGYPYGLCHKGLPKGYELVPGWELYTGNKVIFKMKSETNLYMMKCPVCGTLCASSADRGLLPEWLTCDRCNPTYRLTSMGDKQVIKRLIFPKFSGIVTFGLDADIEEVTLLDDCSDNLIIDRALREAVAWLYCQGH